MSGEIAIRVDNLGKQFRLGARAGSYRTLRETLAGLGLGPRSAAASRGQADLFWALRGVGFEVRRGEVVGVIGRNGAGKSTLLKILSRITPPTEGYIDVFGRIGSLLEVGTGFHPELSGRENVLLNGAILGMSRREIGRKFDEIVAFAEVETFIDMPVKHYSSGMYLRLAFAVAAHLDPEILVLDEVLAVGDAAFQQKCLGKMGEVARQGRTVLFVSHNMGAIGSLTSRSILLEGGRVKSVGPTDDVIKDYMRSAAGGGRTWSASGDNDKPIQILRIEARDDSGGLEGQVDVRSPIAIAIDYVVRRPVRGAVLAVNVHAADGAHLVSLEDADGCRDLLLPRREGRYHAVVTLPGRWFNGGMYTVRVGCGTPRRETFENIEALTIDLIHAADHEVRAHRRGYFLPSIPWETTMISGLEWPTPAPGGATLCQA